MTGLSPETEHKPDSGDQAVPAVVSDDPQPGLLRRLESAFGPILAGLLIDVMDLSTFGPFGVFSGMLLGGALALWICAIYAIPKKQRWIWALIAGAYCTIPMTEFIPIATLAGAYMRYVKPPAEENKDECAEDTH